jgi:hypothetical protein
VSGGSIASLPETGRTCLHSPRRHAIQARPLLHRWLVAIGSAPLLPPPPITLADAPIPHQHLQAGASSIGLNLGTPFNPEAITGSLVRLNTTIGAQGQGMRNGGSLFTAAHVLSYVNAASYNGSVFQGLPFLRTDPPYRSIRLLVGLGAARRRLPARQYRRSRLR